MSRHSRARRDPTAENGLRLAVMRDDVLGRFFNDALTDRGRSLWSPRGAMIRS
jgi:hypothetical protein